MLQMISKTFFVVSSLSRFHNGIYGFGAMRMLPRNPRSLQVGSSTFGGSFDRVSVRPSSSSVSKMSNNENINENLYAENNGIQNDSDYGRGLLILSTVPMAWGTFEPAVRLVYKYEPSMPPLVFSFAYYLVATSILVMISVLSTTEVMFGKFGDTTTESDEALVANKDNFFWGLPRSTLGGIELGTYLFVGNALQVIGLKTIPADKAAFLLQLTTIFVPLLKSGMGEALIPLQTWIACLIALMGVALIGLNDGSLTSYGSSPVDIGSKHHFQDVVSNIFDHLPTFSLEDGYIILAAVFYTFHCIRLETYARSNASAIGLATAKATTEMFWSGIAIIACVLAAVALGGENSAIDMVRVSGDKILSYVEGIRQQQISSSSFLFAEGSGWPSVGLATLWVGAVTVAYTIYAQSFGQSRVPAVTANLIYSSQPIFTAVVAYALLGESMGANGYIGGILIGSAVLLVIPAEVKTEPLVIESDD